MSADPLTLTICSRSGAVRVDARPGSQLSVTGGSMRRADDGSIVVEPSSPSDTIVLSCPSDMDVTVGTMSGKVVLTGSLGNVRIVTESGSVDIDHANATDVRTVSAGVQIRHCAAECRVVTTSGGVEVTHAGSAEVSTKSGRIVVDDTAAANLRSVNGAVSLGISGGGDVRIQAVSSSVKVTVPRGLRPNTLLNSVSGSVRSPLTPGEDGRLEVDTVSGSIRISER